MPPPVLMPLRRRRSAVFSMSPWLRAASAATVTTSSSSANSSSEVSADITHSHALRTPRRTRRTNYADREYLQFPTQFDDAPRGLSTASPFASAPPFFASRGSSDRELYRTGLFLRALATPVIGRVAYGALAAMAYIGYGVGRVALYTRHSTAPPLCNNSPPALCAQDAVRRLIELGAYDQAAASLSHIHNNNNNNNNESSENNIHGIDDTPQGSLFRGILHGNALDCVHIGRSSIHSRGLFTDCDLPRGTRIVTEAQRCFMDAAGFIRLLADTHNKLPDTWHYTHPSGALLELVTQPQPHHLMNHSCDANVCAGLSREFWPAAAASGNAALQERIKEFRDFDDANSFFTTRDVRAGEELTVNYANRVAPLFRGENALGTLFVVCRCGSPNCQHFLYRSSIEPSRLVAAHAQDSDEAQLARLFGAGLDDETVALSLLSSRRSLLEYIRRKLSASRRTTTKRELLVCYRHVFRLLNEAAPKEQPDGDIGRADA